MTKKYPEFRNCYVQEGKSYKLTSDYLQPANLFDYLHLIGLPFDHLRGVPLDNLLFLLLRVFLRYHCNLPMSRKSEKKIGDTWNVLEIL